MRTPRRFVSPARCPERRIGGTDQEVVSLLIAGPAGVPFEATARTVYCGAEGTGYELVG